MDNDEERDALVASAARMLDPSTLMQIAIGAWSAENPDGDVGGLLRHVLVTLDVANDGDQPWPVGPNYRAPGL